MSSPTERQSRPTLKWTTKEPRQMDQRTRKLMVMHKALHPTDDKDRLQMPRKGGKGFTIIKDFIHVTIQGLKEHTKKIKERMITTDTTAKLTEKHTGK